MNTITFTSLRKLMAPAIVAVALAVGGAAPVFAQEIAPEQLALARKYIDLTNKAGIYEAILVNTAANTSKLLSQQNPDITKEIDGTIGEILETYKGKNDELFNQFARVVAIEFTQEELQQIVDFYASPAGQKLTDKAQSINIGIRGVMQVYTNNFGTEFVSKVRAALKAKGFNV